MFIGKGHGRLEHPFDHELGRAHPVCCSGRRTGGRETALSPRRWRRSRCDRYKDGQAALHIAAFTGGVQMNESLISHNADVSAG